MNVNDIVDLKKVKKDKEGIFRSTINLSQVEKGNKEIWERIYNFSSTSMKKDRQDFTANKLADHVKYINASYTFSSKSVYLEIGCGPAYIGEYMMSTYGCYFIGVDFNYPMLVSLYKYFKKHGFNDFILIYADIRDMPIKKRSIDFIYGGGVIEHFQDTEEIVRKLHLLLKKRGVVFNTVPAFNLFWLSRFYSTIPDVVIVRKILEVLHIKILRNSLLNNYHGFELCFTPDRLVMLHENVKFKNVHIGPFAFHPSNRKMKIQLLRDIYYWLSNNILFSPIYYIYAER